MKWLVLDPALAALQFNAPNLADTAIAMASIGDYQTALIGAEIDDHRQMGHARRDSFSSGRYCVRAAQVELALPTQEIGRIERAPIWPQGCIGSISHSPSVAVAALSRSLTGVGVDIEHQGRVTGKIWPKLFTEEETAWLAAAPEFCADLMFSAKEAGYKAIYPLGQQFIGFHEARIEIDLARQQFRIKYLGAHTANKLLDAGTGYWHREQDHVLTIFTLD
jgi:4'-phosphopantetheinyl transferase EntD